MPAKRPDGQKVGSKRSDRRWQTSDGRIWDSRFESEVFISLAGIPEVTVQRCSERGDCSFGYSTPVRGGRCLECEHRQVVQERIDTPDILVNREPYGDEPNDYYIEVKGNLPGHRRNLLRNFLKTGPSIDLRIILQRDGRATKRYSLGEYIDTYLKVPWIVWQGQLPESWK